MLKDKLQQVEESEFNSSSSTTFKFREGRNSIRVLTEPEPLFQDFKRGICYTGCGYQGSAKTLAWVIDNADGKMKLMFIPYTISKLIASWQTDDDWSFESFPMPYDINIDATGAGTKEVDYKVTPRPKRSEVSDDIKELVMKENTCAEIIESLKKKNIEKHKADGSWQKEQDRQAQLKKDLAEARTGIKVVTEDVDMPSFDVDSQGNPL